MKKGRRCKVCKTYMESPRPNQVVCGYQCSFQYAKIQGEKKRKEKVKELKESVKTKSDYLKEVQVVFNQFIRLRDEGKTCISCGKEINGVRHASHYLSVGSSPSVRFNENNVWVSCYKCNVWLSGNQLEYRLRLIDKIGIEQVEQIESLSKQSVHYSIPELIELKQVYKQKIKELQLKQI